ncbi:hypothetical protein SAMN05444401_1739 [Clostridium amylolyticum]|uniref:Uncharacterized protein n=1 Tax=Clostridium amylolyticum TaxID=1121298 RepID=A0A1M6EY71_9CLOT|nr:hypothetical protein [Clostridium amylolyticum]SHI90346.1 hypothetical protein SAMN05444401_1739 [Clostridium amylolyticum]
MRIYKTQNQKDKLFFTNYKRLDEEIVFNEIVDILKSNPSVSIGNKIVGPSEDIYSCNILKEEFELVLDIDYGGYIQSNSEKALNLLENILN